MKDKDWKKQKKRVKKYLDKWVKLLLLDRYKLNVHYMSGNSDKRVGSFVGLASTDTVWAYQEATLKFWLEAFEGLTDTEVERTVVHELCHVLNAPVQGEVEDIDKLEFATEIMTRSILNVYRSK